MQRCLFCVPFSGSLSKGYCLRIGGEQFRSSWPVTPLRLKQERTAQMCMEFSPSPPFFRNGSLSVAPVAHLLISYTLIFHSSNVQESSDSLLGFEALKKKRKSTLGLHFPGETSEQRLCFSFSVGHSPYSSRLSYSCHEYILFSLAPLCI